MTFVFRVVLVAAALTVIVHLAFGALDVPAGVGTALTYAVTLSRAFERYFPIALTLWMFGIAIGVEISLAIYRALTGTVRAVGGSGD